MARKSFLLIKLLGGLSVRIRWQRCQNSRVTSHTFNHTNTYETTTENLLSHISADPCPHRPDPPRYCRK